MPAGDITQGYIFVPAEKNIDAPKMNAIVGQASINPVFVSGQTQASATAAGDYFLLYKANGTLAKILYDDLASSLAAATGFQSQIWSTRLLSFNAIGNPNFEVDQKQCRTVLANPANGTFICDRWSLNRVTTGTLTFSTIPTDSTALIPGTSIIASTYCLNVSLTAAQATLAAGDYCFLTQLIEGPSLRELIGGPHSLKILCQSSVAGLRFAVSLRDNGNTRSLVKLCTIPSANTWTLIELPNLPVWGSGGSFPITPGNPGYSIAITLAAGTTFVASATDVWIAGNFIAATGQANFLASPVGSTFRLLFVQHEPGPQCTQLMDLDFDTNLRRCQRYYFKTYNYSSPAGSVQGGGANATFLCIAATAAEGYGPFNGFMAKGPTVTVYNPLTGGANACADAWTGTALAISSVANVNESSVGRLNAASGLTAGHNLKVHYTADTGW